jgi:NADH-quinone oxidoreductase B subunit
MAMTTAKDGGLSVGFTTIDELLAWSQASSLWIFPMATSCCGIELMAAAASRVDLDRMGTIVRATPRHADVMVVAGTITVKMAPRVRKLWDQMPEPKWCIAMGSCAISGDFYRDLYPVVPGVDTFLPVDVYVPGCPPSPEALMDGLLRLQDKIRRKVDVGERPATPAGMIQPAIRRLGDPERDPAITAEQEEAALRIRDEAEPPWSPEAPPAPAAAPSGDDLDAFFRDRLGATLDASGPPLVDVARHREAAAALVASGHRLLAFIVASHWPGDPEQHEVAVGLRSVGPGTRVASWRVRVPVGTPVPSLAGVVAGADWQEREQQDLVGVVFEGHPDPRRILLPDSWVGHPLRRDHAADSPSRPWR